MRYLRVQLFAVSVLLAVAWIVLGIASPTTKTIRRSEDQVIVQGKTLSDALDWPIEEIRAFAVVQGQAKTVPFQIDEKKENGRYALDYGERKSADDGLLDANDELVFMIFDAGDRISAEALPGGYDAAVEVEIADPQDGGKAWLYLARYTQNAPPLCSRDYVRYNNAKTFVDTQRYQMGFHKKASLSIGHLAIKPAGGGSGRNVVDRMKIRFTAETLGGAIKLDKNEEQFISRTLGWIDGPVRIVRGTANQMKLWKFKTPSAFLYNIYYVNSFEFPTEVNVPFKPGAFLSNPRFRVSTDALCDQPTRMFYNSNNLSGVKMDGIMTEAERNLDMRPYKWSAVSAVGESGAWINRLLYNASATPARPILYYQDDRNHLDPPEDDPGQCGDLGYVLVNLEKVERGKMNLVSIMYNAPNFTLKKVNQYMRILDQPLKVTSRGL